jgi:hypothetical protein
VKLGGIVAGETIHPGLGEMDIRRLSLVLPIELRKNPPSVATTAGLIDRRPAIELMTGEKSPSPGGMPADVAVSAVGMAFHTGLSVDGLQLGPTVSGPLS